MTKCQEQRVSSLPELLCVHIHNNRRSRVSTTSEPPNVQVQVIVWETAMSREKHNNFALSIIESAVM